MIKVPFEEFSLKLPISWNSTYVHSKSFSKQYYVFITQKKTAFENMLGKKENTGSYKVFFSFKAQYYLWHL